MNMYDFQRLTMATLPEAEMTEHVKMGVRALADHTEEATGAAISMDEAQDADEYLDARERLEKMLGFILVDVVEICEGLDVMMSDVAIGNLTELLHYNRTAEKQLNSENADQKGLLRAIYELAGKAVQTNE